MVGKPPSPATRVLPSARFDVHAHPGAHRERVALLPDGALAVWVRARAVEGRANEALRGALADALGVRRSQVVLVGGAARRRKIVRVDGLDAAAIRARLAHLEAGDPQRSGG